MFAVEWGTGQVLWSLIYLFLLVLWFWLIITIFADLIRSDMSGWAKAAWTIGIIFLPFLGILLYLIVEGRHMRDRAMAQAQTMDRERREYIRQAASEGSGAADQLEKLAQLHQSGSLSDEEYARAKERVLAS